MYLKRILTFLGDLQAQLWGPRCPQIAQIFNKMQFVAQSNKGELNVFRSCLRGEGVASAAWSRCQWVDSKLLIHILCAQSCLLTDTYVRSVAVSASNKLGPRQLVDV